MAGAVSEVQNIVIKGRAELERAFLEMRRTTLVGLKPALFAALEPVRRDAESLNVTNIENIGPTWSQVRLGASASRDAVLAYMAPKVRRGRGSRRPNLAPLLAKDMEDARDSHQDEIVAALDLLVDEAATSSGLL